MEKIKLAIVDDHVLLRNALANLINSFDNIKVIYEAKSGRDMIEKFKDQLRPDVVLLDLSMPEMDGYETAVWLKDHHPDIQVLMLTMYDSELTLIRLLQAGVKGFLKKDIDPAELKYAINSVVSSGYYYSTQTAGRLANLFRNSSVSNPKVQNALMSDQEIEFLKLACTDKTYKEIAQQMNLSPRSVDALRDHLFVKLDVKSRVGLAMMAIKNGVVTMT
jgi:two-component system, NarL family, invasion response regulator UvrY